MKTNKEFEDRKLRLIETLDNKIPNWRNDVLDDFLHSLLAS